MKKVLVLRPQPGADETARRARALGLEPIVAPLFAVQPLPWAMPQGDFDALLLTSANAARHAGTLPNLRCYAVGDATAEAARTAGLENVLSGPSDGAAALALAARNGARRILHLCGREHIPVDHEGVEVVRRIVYAADIARGLAEVAQAAAAEGALVLLHSPRAAAAFAALTTARERVRIAAISPAAAAAAGGGWADVQTARQPRDDALLELAAELCKAAPAQVRDGIGTDGV